MTPRIVLGVLFIALILFCGWQLKRSGELQAVNQQYESAIEDMRTAILDQHQRYLETDQLLAASRRQSKAVERKAWRLENDLQQQSSECINTVISDDIVNRVLEFQSSKD